MTEVVNISIFGIPSAAVLRIEVPVPDGFTGEHQEAFTEGVAQGVAHTLNAMEIPPDPELTFDNPSE